MPVNGLSSIHVPYVPSGGLMHLLDPSSLRVPSASTLHPQLVLSSITAGSYAQRSIKEIFRLITQFISATWIYWAPVCRRLVHTFYYLTFPTLCK